MQRPTTMLRDLVPPTGLFPAYLTAASRICDAPGIYHIGCLLAALSACVTPHCTGLYRSANRRRNEPLFLWIMLMGESGSRKTEALKKCKGLMLHKDLLRPRARSALGSRRGLVEMLHVEPRPFVLIEEAAAWFRSNRAAYMHDGAATWCEIYDGDILDSNLIDNVQENASRAEPPPIQVSLLATGATPAVMRATRIEDWNSGLLARVMILSAEVPVDRLGPYSWTEPALARLRDQIREIVGVAQQHGVVRVEDDARALWDGWLLDLGGRSRGVSETHGILLRRLPAFAVRIACLFALSRGSHRASVDDMTRALRLVDVSYDCVLALDLR